MIVCCPKSRLRSLNCRHERDAKHEIREPRKESPHMHMRYTNFLVVFFSAAYVERESELDLMVCCYAFLFFSFSVGLSRKFVTRISSNVASFEKRSRTQLWKLLHNKSKTRWKWLQSEALEKAFRLMFEKLWLMMVWLCKLLLNYNNTASK